MRLVRFFTICFLLFSAKLCFAESSVLIKKEESFINGNKIIFHTTEFNPKLNKMLISQSQDLNLKSFRISEVAKKLDAQVVVNGSFFKIYDNFGRKIDSDLLNSNLPKGAPPPYTAVAYTTTKKNGRFFSVEFKPQAALGWNESGEHVLFDKINVDGSLELINPSGGKSVFKINGFNNLNCKKGICVFADNWKIPLFFSGKGLIYTAKIAKSSNSKYNVFIKKLMRVKNKKFENRKFRINHIEKDTFLIYVDSDKLRNSLKLKSKLNINFTVAPEESDNQEKWNKFDFIISGIPMLIKNSFVYMDFPNKKFYNKKYARTAICELSNKNIVLFTIDGGGSDGDGKIGATLSELQEIMINKHCINGLNLDGGGSTILYAHGEVLNQYQSLSGKNAGQNVTERFLSDAIVVQ